MGKAHSKKKQSKLEKDAHDEDIDSEGILPAKMSKSHKSESKCSLVKSEPSSKQKEVDQKPNSILVEKYKDDKQDDFEYFWKPRDILSQWFPCKFNIDGTDYNCAEQYMMQQKAILFGDTVMAELIMAIDEPREQKHLARRVNKDEALWNDCCCDVVKRGNIAKFSQNRRLKLFLFSTYPKILAEASPVDTKWGIGLSADDPRAWNRATWQGRNYLGYVLMEVRDELMKDDGIL